MFKDTTATEAKASPMSAGAKPVTEDEWNAILDGWRRSSRFYARTGNCGRFCSVAKARPKNCGAATRNWKRSCGNSPRMLLGAATTMGLAAKNESTDALRRA